jgi:hypothetical protein
MYLTYTPLIEHRLFILTDVPVCLILLLILLKYLKVLSSEMDPAEIRLIRLVFIKERGAEGF